MTDYKKIFQLALQSEKEKDLQKAYRHSKQLPLDNSKYFSNHLRITKSCMEQGLLEITRLDELYEDQSGSSYTAIFNYFDPASILHAVEIHQQLHTHPKAYVWTADSVLYNKEKGLTALYFGDIKTNLIFNHFRKNPEVTKTFKHINEYVPTEKELQQVQDSVRSGETLRIELTKGLNLIDFDSKYPALEINTQDTHGKNINTKLKPLIERLYGSMEIKDGTSAFAENMKSRSEKGIQKLSIRFINLNDQDYTAFQRPIVRACWFRAFSENEISLSIEEVDFVSYLGVLK